MSAFETGSPRSPRAGRGSVEDEVEVLQPGTLKVSVRYAETGDAQVLYFPAATSTVEELKRQTVEYAEHGVNCRPATMILLLDDGTSLTKSNTLLSTLTSLTVFMFGRETLLKTYTPTVALEDFRELDMNGDFDGEMKRELCERCLGRCKVQIEAGDVALRNLVEHSKAVEKSLARYRTSNYQAYLKKAEILSTFERDLEKLANLPLARAVGKLSAAPTERKSMLDVLPKDKLRRWTEDASKQHDIVEQKHDELHVLARTIEEGCETVVRQWDEMRTESASEVTKLEQTLKAATETGMDDLVNALKELKAQTTKALFPTLLRTISTLQSRIQDLSNKLAALKEALVVQEQKLAQIGVIHSLPEAYEAGLREAERRRQFVTAHYAKVTQLTDYIARERNTELDRREQFNRKYGKILPHELVPGLFPWVFPACDVTQRPIDPVLFSNALETSPGEVAESTRAVETAPAVAEEGELLFEPDSAAPETELTAIEILELQAENEALRASAAPGGETGSFVEKLKEQHAKEMESMRTRVAELEAAISNHGASAASPANEAKPPVEVVSSPSNEESASSPSNDESGGETLSVESPASKQAVSTPEAPMEESVPQREHQSESSEVAAVPSPNTEDDASKDSEQPPTGEEAEQEESANDRSSDGAEQAMDVE